MRKSIWVLSLAIAGFLLAPAAVRACDFATVISGACPQSDMEPLQVTGGDRSVTLERVLWTKTTPYTSLAPDEDIVLNVCFMPLHPPVLDRLVREVRRGVADWETVSGSVFMQDAAGNDVEVDRESRLRFAMRDGSGKPNLCTDGGTYQIRVKFNTVRTNSSFLGTQSLGKDVSMRLSYNGSTLTIQPGIVAHEFGHALGLEHEMVHPAFADCAANFDALNYVRTSGTTFGDNLSEARKVELAKQNITRIAKRGQGYAITQDMDRASVMTYGLSRIYFNVSDPRKCEFRSNFRPSSGDLASILTYYGREM